MDKDIDTKTFWRLLGMRAIGAAAVTAQGSKGPAGFLALSTTHVTANPPTMLVSIGRKTSALSAISESGNFAINYLPKERDDLASLFGGQGDEKGADRFKPGEWTVLATGAPILVGAVGSIDCRVEDAIERHDVIIFLGRIVDWVQNASRLLLISFAGSYTTI
ncbi:flavin reductase family protein [Bradyrhizobium sp. WSM2793]|uniref:flavin reductase family protein n=1 Tax=Bradyrhizobium sp. WSM2793 TaxID=1038866 RepID=UPI0012F91680|nr:flavin reductase family protein [Bradyrhizobium sp. WSM2793]